MAQIVLGMASSHAPQLAMPPDQWRAYGDRSRTLPEHWFQGKTYSYPDLVEARAEEHLDRECTDEKFQARFDACQKAIAHLSDTLARVSPDVCVIFGDDQHEVFNDDNIPALAIFYGETMDDAPRQNELRDRTIDNSPTERITQPGHPDLGQHLIETLSAGDFDLTRTKVLPQGRLNGAIGHAFYYVYRRLMDNKALPNVPVMVNTYYPPNVPSAARCYKLGQAVREAIEAWDSDARVALFASGGLSHTVIEEELDARILDGLVNDDVVKLTDYPD
ncbi:MAG: protocatechuate 3,4-dioxygenase, partial [Dehalococcoidia bacterium]